ncbi:MAG: EAL domain-containing protein [Magnetococcus sp. DMHC-6]
MVLKLRLKMLLMFAVGLFFLFGVQFGIARLIVLKQANALEEEKAYASLERIQSLFEDNAQQLISLTSDWAAWDDAYQYMENGNADFLNSNFTNSTFKRLKIDGIFLIDQKGQTRHTQGMHYADQKEWSLPQNLLNLLQTKSSTLKDTSAGLTGFVTLESKSYLVAIHPILTSNGEGPNRGTMTMLRLMDTPFLKEISKLAHFPLDITSIGELAEKGIKIDNFHDYKHLLSVNDDSPTGPFQVGFVILNDLDGQPSLTVRTTMDRKIIQQGQETLLYLIYSSVAILLALLGFSLFLDRVVLVPISRLSREIADIDAHVTPPMNVTNIPGKDELNHLTVGINAMLHRLESSLITLRQQREELKLAAKVMENSHELILITDAKNRIIKVNEGFCQITGYTEEEVLGNKPNLLRSEQYGAEFYAEMWAKLLKDGFWHGEIWNRRKNGDIFPEWLSISVVKNSQEEVEHYIAIGSDLTELKMADRRISQLANYDQLTQLPNRTLLSTQIEHAIHNAKSYHRHCGVLLLGLNRFKHLNDSLGHDSGNNVLQQVATRLTETVGQGTTVARVGGDIFVLLISQFNDPGVLVRLAYNAMDAIAKPFMVNGQEVVLSASVGISFYPSDGENAEDLLRHGEQAMFLAKSQGRHTYAFFKTQMQEEAQERFILENNLRKSLENNELFLNYQPQFNMSGTKMIGSEALIRWRHPLLGIIPPGKFIPVAEESGLVVPIGNWVLETACRQVQAWQEAGLQTVMVAINVSAIQFRQPGFAAFVRHVLAQTGLNPKLLELEMTESLLIQDITTTIAILKELKELGIKLAIDDFGTGYSSLNYLSQFPLDKLKVDQSFVKGLPKDTDNAVIATAIIHLAHSLHLQVIAEGVETVEQLEFLTSQGCDEVQGYLFARPLPPEEFVKRLAQRMPTEHDALRAKN